MEIGRAVKSETRTTGEDDGAELVIEDFLYGIKDGRSLTMKKKRLEKATGDEYVQLKD